MKTIVSTDFDEIADAISGVAGRFVPTSRSMGSWSVRLVGTGQATAQILEVGSATAFAGDGKTAAITLGIPLSPPGQIHVDDDVFGESSFLLIKEGQPFTVASRHSMRWAGVTLPLNGPMAMRDYGRLRARFSQGAHTQTESSYLTRVKAMVARLCVEDSDELPIAGAAARAVEDEILMLATLALESSSKAEPKSIGRPRYCRDKIIGRTLELLQANEARSYSIQDLCNETRVSERTLRNVFLEHFGVGPMRLLKARQLCAVRSALINTQPGSERVGEIARRFGIWDLSAFAQQYKQLFGELPSQTLHKSSAAFTRDEDDGATWLRFALRCSSGGVLVK